MLKTTLRFPARRGPARAAAAAWLAAALIFGSAPAHADEWADCTNIATDKAAMERAVVACTAVIASKQRPPADLPKAYLLRGIANQRTGKLDDAIADFTKALEYDPNSSDALAWRGLARVQAQQFEQAEGDFDRAIAIDPTKEFSYVTRGHVGWAARLGAGDRRRDQSD